MGTSQEPVIRLWFQSCEMRNRSKRGCFEYHYSGRKNAYINSLDDRGSIYNHGVEHGIQPSFIQFTSIRPSYGPSPGDNRHPDWCKGTGWDFREGRVSRGQGFERAGFPSSVGEISAGMLLGTGDPGSGISRRDDRDLCRGQESHQSLYLSHPGEA
jgi:hypothetical protein